jgi:hypothetical protein
VEILPSLRIKIFKNETKKIQKHMDSKILFCVVIPLGHVDRYHCLEDKTVSIFRAESTKQTSATSLP